MRKKRPSGRSTGTTRHSGAWKRTVTPLASEATTVIPPPASAARTAPGRRAPTTTRTRAAAVRARAGHRGTRVTVADMGARLLPVRWIGLRVGGVGQGRSRPLTLLPASGRAGSTGSRIVAARAAGYHRGDARPRRPFAI